MASTFYSDQFDSDGNVLVRRYVESGVFSVTGTREIAAALVVSDLIKMVPVPKGAKVLDVVLSTDRLDTGTSIELDVGDTDDTDDTDRYIDSAAGLVGTTATALGVTTGITAARLNNPAGHNYKFVADGTIDVLVKTAPETGTTTGTITLTVFLAVDN